MHRGVFSFRAFVIACIHCMVVKQTLQVFIPLFAPVLSAGRGKEQQQAGKQEQGSES